jgi:hypothetical protein
VGFYENFTVMKFYRNNFQFQENNEGIVKFFRAVGRGKRRQAERRAASPKAATGEKKIVFARRKESGEAQIWTLSALQCRWGQQENALATVSALPSRGSCE